MAEAVGTIAIEILLQKLIAVSEEEIRLIKNFSKDLQKLKDSAATIRKFLEDAEKNVITNKSVEHWLKKLDDVVFNADYIFDEISYHTLRKKVEKGTKMKNKVRCFFPNCKSLSFHREMARKIKDIQQDLEAINEEARQLGLVQKIESVSPRGDDELSRETNSLSRDQVFVGRENDAMKIVEKVKNSPSQNKVSVIPIIGMGGLGKTTLAREVLHDGNIKSHFENRIWVYVSEKFVPETIFKSVFSSLTRTSVDGSSEVVLTKLREKIGDKRYLLVLDDVWNEDRAKWDNFITSLEAISPPKGNVVLITTRNENVASIMKTSYIHKLGSLSKEECWCIIKAKAFGDDSVPKEFENIGESIAKKCGGLPLAAKVVGDLLRGKSEDEWRSIEKEGFGEDVKDVSKILKLSSNNFPSPSMKKCFAYCSILPKGWSMQRDEMIHLWMAEGFLQTKDMENEGDMVFNRLLQSSLLQVKDRNWVDIVERFGRNWGDIVEQFGMHDLVHDLASSILNPKFLDGAHPVRYTSKAFADESSPIPEEHATFLRALFFSGKISHLTFSNFTRLHVLILNGDEMRELPVEISKLICLRLLDISNTKMEHLPDSIGKLYHLQTLRATKEHGGEGSLKKLPHTLKFLTNLRHLYIPRIELPRDVGKLSSLQTLPYFQVGNEEGCGIIELGSLNNLKGTMQIHNLEKVRNKVEAKNANLFHKPNILKLKLVWNESRENDLNSDENVLEGLQPHWNLEGLEIEGFKGNNFPLWTLRMEVRYDVEDRWIKLDNLLEIKLSNCNECEEIPMMGQLRRLKSLCLIGLSNVKSIGSSFYGIKEDDFNKRATIDVFPELERLFLIIMGNLSTWTEFELPSSSSTQPRKVSVFRRLKYLSIKDCPQLESAPSHFPSLNELRIDGVESGIPLASICGSKLTTLTQLTIYNVNELVCLPEGLFMSNRDLSVLMIGWCSNLTHLIPCLGGGGASLRMLRISDCSQLEKLPVDLYKLNALKELSICECPNLKSIEYPSERQLSQALTSLRSLEFNKCSGLTNLPCMLLESCAPSLEIMGLNGAVSLTNLLQVMSFLPKMPRLKMLGIRSIPGLEDAVVKKGSFGNIEELYIGGCGDCVSVDRIMPAFPSLRELFLFGMEDWDALPEQLQHLTTLQGLWIVNFGIQVLPEWFEKLSSLRKLDISDCKKLRHLASKKVMKGLTTLETLYIWQCPLLKQNLEEDRNDGSEWSKVSHIKDTRVDYEPVTRQVG